MGIEKYNTDNPKRSSVFFGFDFVGDRNPVSGVAITHRIGVTITGKGNVLKESVAYPLESTDPSEFNQRVLVYTVGRWAD
jgi:hypothetical protein